MTNPFTGSMVALVTPFRNGQVDFKALDAIIEMQIEAGTDVLVPCGTTGESPTLTHEEHDAVNAAVIKRAKGRCLVLAGTGSNATDEAIQLTRHARDAGADGSLQVAPYYNRPTQEGLYRHFATIGEAVEFPHVLYNIPGRCGVEIAADTMIRLRKSHPCYVAVKHATGQMDGASDLVTRSDLAVISGDDSLTLPLMSIGAVGVISVLANIIPKDVKAMVGAAAAGDWTTARQLHLKMFKLARAMFVETNPVPIKTAMATCCMMAEEFRLPMCPMLPANREKLLEAMQDYGLWSR